MATTMWDIARELNLSQTTVSKALSDKNGHDIPADTKQRVRETAQKMGYRPNHLARALSSRRSYLISLMVRNMHPAFYSRSIAAVEAALRGTGYDLRVRETNSWTVERWREAATDRWPVDGVIVLESMYDLPHMLEEAKGDLPIVNMGALCSSEVDNVQVDLRTGTIEAIQHFIKTGRKRIGFLAIDSVNPIDLRVLAYETEMQRIGAESRRIVMKRSGESSQRTMARHAVTEYLHAGCDIDSLFCLNDEYAIGALRAIKEFGLRVPEDIALIGCDDIEDADYQDPRLSTVQYPYEEAAHLAWEMLRRRIEKPELPRQSILLPSKLIVRQSSPP